MNRKSERAGTSAAGD